MIDVIKIRRTPYAQDRWCGDTIRDSDLLRKCDCPRYFKDNQYDEVLNKVSAYGFWLESPIEA